MLQRFQRGAMPVIPVIHGARVTCKTEHRRVMVFRAGPGYQSGYYDCQPTVRDRNAWVSGEAHWFEAQR